MLPKYPDRLAVKFAVLKRKVTYDDIASIIAPELPDEEASEDRQTGIAIYLVGRGRKLIKQNLFNQK